MTNETNNFEQVREQIMLNENKSFEAPQIPELEIPEHKILLEITGEKNENLFDDNFLVEVVAPKFCLKNSLSEKSFEQKSGIIIAMEQAPDVIKNIFKACKQKINCKLHLAVEDEVYSTWEFINANIVAVNLGVLTKGAINQKRDSFVECELEFEGIIVDGESIY